MNGDAPPPRRRFSWAAAFTLIALIFAALAAFIFARCESWPGRRLSDLERAARDLRDAFVSIAQLQPKVTVNDRVYLEQTSPRAELVVLARRTEVEHEMTHRWAGSTKRIKFHGTFAVKAGFDLRKEFAVDVQPDAIAVRLPRAEILGVEQEKTEVLALENGFWNVISASDVEAQLATLPQLARAKAEQAGVAAEAERAFREQLESKVHTKQPVNVTFEIARPGE